LGALTSIALSAIGPYFLNPGAINAGGKIEFLYGGVLCFAFLYCYLRLPELKGRTYEEIDVMFARNVPTRQFAKYKFEDASDPTVPTQREEAA
jgi:SP family general alpha glucoside:H+ symporter-like MFS transporter